MADESLPITLAPGSDFMLEVAKGGVPGHSHINKFGRNSDIDTDTDPEDVWDGGSLWVPPTAARIHDITSTSASDAGTVVSSGTASKGGSSTSLVDLTADFVTDGVAVGDTVLNDTTMEHATVSAVAATTLTCTPSRHSGVLGNDGDSYRVVTPASSGAAVTHIRGLDENMAQQEEFVVNNGTTGVGTAGTYWRIFRMHTDAAASRNNTNVGIIKATARGDGTVTAQINAGNGQTLMAIYTIPRGKTGYMTQWHVSLNRTGGGTAYADVSLLEVPFASLNGAGTRLADFIGASATGTSAPPIRFIPPRPFLAETDIIVRVAGVSASNCDISASFDLILVDDRV